MTNDELKALCESNARSVQANSSAIADLGRGMVQFREAADAFTSELRSWVEVHNQISDDQGADLVRMDSADRTHDAQITAIREATNADRQAFVNQMNADRDRSDQRFAAQQEILQRMLLEIRSTNGAVAGLSDRIDGLEQAS